MYYTVDISNLFRPDAAVTLPTVANTTMDESNA